MKFYKGSKKLNYLYLIILSFLLLANDINSLSSQLSFMKSSLSLMNSLNNYKESRRSKTTSSRFLRRTEEYNEINKSSAIKGFISKEDIKLDSYGAITLEENNKITLWNTIPSNKSNIIAETKIIRQRYNKGWDKLSVSSYKNKANAFVQSYFAGYLEGRITAPEIDKFVKIKNQYKPVNKTQKRISEFFEKVNSNLEKKITTINSISDKQDQLIWSQFLLGYAQLKGLLAGYLYEAERNNFEKITISRLLLIQADGELNELAKAFKFNEDNKKYDLNNKNYFKEAFDINTTDPEEFWTTLMKTGRCSAFIKLLKDEKGNAIDLMVGHTTWGETIELLRIYKYNNFEFEANDDLPQVRLTFSAYPGTLSSTDDYYITNNKLVVTETTIEVVDINLYASMKTSDTYLPNFLRVLAATRFAKTAKEWVQHFSKINSGTYSSQWLILDYKEFDKVKNTNKIPKNVFYMLEQIPNRIISHDVTKYLWENNFFGGYNRAFFDESNKTLHQALINNLYGPLLGDYKASRRGKQFQFLESTVKGLKSIMDIMRYNGYKLNNFPKDSSNKKPNTAISARYDLPNGMLGNFIGGTDAKVTNSEFVKDMINIAVNGPTNDLHNINVTPFTYADKKIPELLGLPVVIKFPFIKIDPKTFSDDSVDDTFKFDTVPKLNLK